MQDRAGAEDVVGDPALEASAALGERDDLVEVGGPERAAEAEERRGRIAEYADKFKRATYHAGKRPWGVKSQLAFPCATQNEIDGDDARALIANGVMSVADEPG